MILQYDSLSNPKNMKAKDMFKEEYTQVFSIKTGNYIGIVIEGQEFNFDEVEEVTPEPEPQKNKLQLSLF